MQRQRSAVVMHSGFGRGLLGSGLSLALISYQALDMALDPSMPFFPALQSVRKNSAYLTGLL